MKITPLKTILKNSGLKQIPLVYVVGVKKGNKIISEWGEYTDYKIAEKAKKELQKYKKYKLVVFSKEAQKCPYCGHLTAKENIDTFGKCLACEDIQSFEMRSSF